MYLYQKGLLKKWYEAYKAGYEDDPTGAKAIEKVIGKPLAKIEADWLKWAAKIESVPVRLAADQAYIGVQLAKQVDGLKILRIVPGSAADLGGLKVGDIIVKLDGRRMADSGELLRTVTAHEVGDKVKIEFRRGGKYKTITVKLGAVPSDLSSLQWPARKVKYGNQLARNRAA
jgi:S1-C subfamily serine protease